MGQRIQDGTAVPDTVVDRIALTLAVLLSLAAYLPRLGFYSDDWSFFGAYATAESPTVGGYFRASYSAHHAMRPVQLWLCAIAYRVFGLEPLGYHLFNAALIVLNPLLCYSLLRELQVHRVVALPVAFIYALLPSYSTDRYWFLAFAITLSMTACLASMLADVRAAAVGGRIGYAWKAAGLAAALVSGLAYEVALPLLLLTPVLMTIRTWQSVRRPGRRRALQLAVFLVVHVALLAAMVGFKLRTTVRLGAGEGALRAQITYIAGEAFRTDVPEGAYGLNVFTAARVHFGTYGVFLGRTAATAARLAPAWLQWGTIAFGAAAFLYLVFALRAGPWPSRGGWAAVIVAGLVVFSLGYAVFLTNYNVQFTAAGIANRSAIAAALGAALCLVGVGGLVASLTHGRVRAIGLAAFIAMAGSSGLLILNVVANCWAEAWAVERAILAGIQQRFPTLPPHSTLLLDGVCPYVGPAVVFEANWDLAGALHTLYRDPTLKADVVTPRLTVTSDAIVTTIYQQPTSYPYANELFVYHAGTGAVHRLPDAAAARAYFAQSTHAAACPPAQEGVGVRLF
ncbi:MAG TPA: hypothetical protein VFZ73_12785 [Gemmatimonadaceae bacterium]